MGTILPDDVLFFFLDNGIVRDVEGSTFVFMVRRAFYFEGPAAVAFEITGDVTRADFSELGDDIAWTGVTDSLTGVLTFTGNEEKGRFGVDKGISLKTTMNSVAGGG